MQLCQRPPKEDENTWSSPSPSQCVDPVRISNQYRLNGLTRIECAGLELDEAFAIGAGAFGEDEYRREVLLEPLRVGMDAVHNVLDCGRARVVILSADVDRLSEIDEL